MARCEAKDPNKEDDNDTTKQQQHKKKEKKKTTKQKQSDGEFKDFEKYATHDNRHNNKK